MSQYYSEDITVHPTRIVTRAWFELDKNPLNLPPITLRLQTLPSSSREAQLWVFRIQPEDVAHLRRILDEVLKASGTG